MSDYIKPYSHEVGECYSYASAGYDVFVYKVLGYDKKQLSVEVLLSNMSRHNPELKIGNIINVDPEASIAILAVKAEAMKNAIFRNVFYQQ